MDPPQSTTASVTATHASSAAPGARGKRVDEERQLDVAEWRRQTRAMQQQRQLDRRPPIDISADAPDSCRALRPWNATVAG